jgi:hypothetical protein
MSTTISPVTSANQALISKLNTINLLRAQKIASKIVDEQNALQTLINLRSMEAQTLLANYVTATNTFLVT